MSHDNPKSKLNQFLQKMTGRMISKADVTFTTQKHEGMGYQGTLVLNCLNNEEYAGELASTAKEAEQNAAQQALDAHADDIERIGLQKGTKRKKSGGAAALTMDQFASKFGQMSEQDLAQYTSGSDGELSMEQLAQICFGDQAQGQDGNAASTGGSGRLKLSLAGGGGGGNFKLNLTGPRPDYEPPAKRAKAEPGSGAPPMKEDGTPDVPWKMQLNGLVMKLVRRPLAKGDIKWATEQFQPGQHQTTVTLPELPDLGIIEFNGHPMTTQKQAENSAAEVAVTAILENPQLQSIAAAKASPQQNPGYVPPKIMLNGLVMKLRRVPFAKGEGNGILWNTTEFSPGEFQATLQLPELPDVGILEFNGHPCRTAKEAENSAAEVALHAMDESPEIQRLLDMIPKKKNKGSGGGQSCETVDGGSHKQTLNAILGKLMRRPLQAGDIKYESQRILDGELETTITLPELEGIGILQFKGEPIRGIRLSEQNAAEAAVKALLEEPLLQAPLQALLASKEARQSQKGKGKGKVKGWGKGKDWGKGKMKFSW